MKKYPFYEVKSIQHLDNDDKKIVYLTDGRVMLYEFVSYSAFQGIRMVADEDVIGYLTRGGDRERVYTIFEIFGDPGQYITPGFYPPRDDN